MENKQEEKNIPQKPRNLIKNWRIKKIKRSKKAKSRKYKKEEKKSRTRETKNLSTDADSRTDTILEGLRDLSKKKK